MIDHVWFDLGYTLVRLNREKVMKNILHNFDFDIDISKLEIAYHLTDKYFMKNYPGVLARNIDEYYPWYIGLLTYNLGIKVNLHELYNNIVVQRKNEPLIWSTFEDTHEVLSCLNENGIKVGLISNWDTTARNILIENDIEKYFSYIFISSEVGYEKPDERIFSNALNEACINPERALYVGDNYYDDYLGASKIDMKCLILNRFDTLGIEELKIKPLKKLSDVLNYLEI